MKGAEIKPLTSLRFFAAAWVVIFHFLSPILVADPRVPSIVAHVARVGYLGVPVFFVLSGFILWHTYAAAGFSEPGRTRSFWVARVARVYPLYLLAFVLSVALFSTMYALYPETFTRPGDRTLGVLLAPFLLQAWVPAAACTWNCPDWSLSVEAAFYLSFPFLVGAAQRWRLFLPALATVSAALCAGVLALYAGGLDLPRNLLFYNPLLHLPAFAVGMMLGRALPALRRHARWAPALVLAGLLGILATSVVVTQWASARGLEGHVLLNTAVTVPFVALLVAGLAVLGGPLGRLLSARGLVLLGNASYATYLLQFPVVIALYLIPGVIDSAVGEGTYAGFALVFALLVAASLAAYHWFEVPMRSWVRARLDRPSAAAPARPTGEVALPR